MKRIPLAALLATASTSILSAQAASDVIIDRVQQPAAPTSPDAAPPAKDAEKGDLDGGTQRIAETRKMPFKLTLNYDVQAFYTTNVFLQPSDEVEAFVVANTLQTRAEFNSMAVGQILLTPTVGLVYQHYNHALGSGDTLRESLDFDAYVLPLGLRLRFSDNWEVNLGVTGTAVYTIEPSYELTYKSIGTYLSARKLFVFSPTQLLSIGAGVNFVKTDAETLFVRTDRNDKVDTSFDVGYYYLNDRWVFGPYARLTYSDYLHYQEAVSTDVDRRDLTLSLGASVSYNLNAWAVARAFTSADWRDPQGEDPNNTYRYQSQNLGLGLSLSASF